MRKAQGARSFPIWMKTQVEHSPHKFRSQTGDPGGESFRYLVEPDDTTLLIGRPRRRHPSATENVQQLVMAILLLETRTAILRLVAIAVWGQPNLQKPCRVMPVIHLLQGHAKSHSLIQARAHKYTRISSNPWHLNMRLRPCLPALFGSTRHTI
jgi:hypothetical protein